MKKVVLIMVMVIGVFADDVVHYDKKEVKQDTIKTNHPVCGSNEEKFIKTNHPDGK